MDDPTNYEGGDVVWVKLGNCWWPGEVCEESQLPQGILRAVKKRPLCIVRFFEETKYEYVKNMNHICKYNNPRKNEFIRKGLDLLRSNKKYMEKFPADVCYAERLTHGDEDIISSDEFSPVKVSKKIAYSDIFGDHTSRKKSNSNKKPASRTVVKKKNRSPSPSPLKASFLYAPTPVLPPRPAKPQPETYNCKICTFTTTRCNIMIMHMKTHSKTNQITKDADPKSYADENKTETQGIKSAKDGEEQMHDKEKETSFPNNEKNVVAEPENIPEKTVASTQVSRPKTRKLPKKPGLKHMILADWSEDEDDDANDTKTSGQPEDPRTKSSDTCQPHSENRSPNLLFNQKLTALSNTAPVVPKYRNIPKKDRRDIILSEFSAYSSASSHENGQLQWPTFDKNEKDSGLENSEVHADCHRTTEQISIDTPRKIVEEADSDATKLRVENSHEKNLIATEGTNEAVIVKDKETKILSCFEFKDDEEDTGDILSSFSKLKQKYMSLEKGKSAEGEEQPILDKNEEAIQEKDEQLASEIENLLNATATPELLKVENESIPDVRALPPKERGKRIFKSRNRSRPDKLDVETKTDDRMISNEFKKDDLIENFACTVNKIDGGCRSPEDNANIQGNHPLMTFADSMIVESEMQATPVVSDENVVVTGSRDKLKDVTYPVIEKGVFIPSDEDYTPLVQPPAASQSDISLDEHESIDSTVVELSEGSPHFPPVDNEHDLNVLAAAETLISIPSKLRAESQLEPIPNEATYQPDMHNSISHSVMYASVHVQLPENDLGSASTKPFEFAGEHPNEEIVIAPKSSDNFSENQTFCERLVSNTECLASADVECSESCQTISTLNKWQERSSRNGNDPEVIAIERSIDLNIAESLEDANQIIGFENRLETNLSTSRHQKGKKSTPSKTHSIEDGVIDNNGDDMETAACIGDKLNDPTDLRYENNMDTLATASLNQQSFNTSLVCGNENSTNEQKAQIAGAEEKPLDFQNDSTLDQSSLSDMIVTDSGLARGSHETSNAYKEYEAMKGAVANDQIALNDQSGGRTDFDFEKLDLGHLQSQDLQNDSNASIDMRHRTSTPFEKQVLAGNIAEKISGEEQHLDSRIEDLSVALDSSNQSEGTQGSPHADADKPDAIAKRENNPIFPQHECSNVVHSYAESITVNETQEIATQSSEYLPDSEDKPLVIDMDFSQGNEVSEEIETDIYAGEVLKVRNVETADEDAEASNEVSVRKQIVLDDDIKDVTETADEVQTQCSESFEDKEVNAAEQILDEISNLTSSIDIILDSERAADEVEMQMSDQAKEVESENARPESEVLAAEPQVNTDPGNSIKTVAQEDEIIEITHPSNILVPAKEIDLQNQLLVSEATSRTGKIRKSHLKYTPPKSKSVFNDGVAESNIDQTQLIQENSEHNTESNSDLSLDIKPTPNRESVMKSNDENSCTNRKSRDSEVLEEFKLGVKEVGKDGIDNLDKVEIRQRDPPVALNFNLLQFDTDPFIETSMDEHLKRISPNNESSFFSGNVTEKLSETQGTSKQMNTQKLSYLPSSMPDSKKSTKKRISRLKDPSTKPPVATTISEEIQERFKVYSFDEQADAFDVPKKAKYSTSKENKSDRHSSKADRKCHSSDSLKPHGPISEKSKHSRSRQLNLQNVSDVCIPKFPKIDRTKRPPALQLESNDLVRSEFMCSINTDKVSIPDLHCFKSDERPKKKTAGFNVHASVFETESGKEFHPSKVGRTSKASNNEANVPVDIPSPKYTHFHTNLSSGSIAMNSSQKKKSRTSSSQNKKQKIQATDQLCIQQQILPQNYYDTYSSQHAIEPSPHLINSAPKNGKHSSKDKFSRKQNAALEEQEQDLPSFGTMQVATNDKHCQVISSQTIVMAGGSVASPKGPFIKTCAADPLFITSKGNLIASNPGSSTYSSGYFESKKLQQRATDLITNVIPFHSSPPMDQITHLGVSQKLPITSGCAPVVSAVVSNTTNRRASEMARDDATNTASNLAEIKRLEQKPVGKVLTAHGFNELETAANNVVLHGKSSAHDCGSGSLDMPVLVPIGEPHTSTPRTPSKRQSSLTSAKETTRMPKQMKHSHDANVSGQHMIAGAANIESSKHDLPESIFGQQSTHVQTMASLQQPKNHRQASNQRTESQHQQQSHQYQMFHESPTTDCTSQLQLPDQQSISNLHNAEQIKIYQQPHGQEELQQANSRQVNHGKRRKVSNDQHMNIGQQKKMIEQQQIKLHHEPDSAKMQQVPSQYKTAQEQQLFEQTHHNMQKHDPEPHLHLSQQLQHEQQIHQEQQMQHEQQMHQEHQIQLQLQLQQEQQMQIEQQLQQDVPLQQEDQEIILQQSEDGEALLGDEILLQEAGGNTIFLQWKNIVGVLNSEDGEIRGLRLASGETLYIAQADGNEVTGELVDQAIQLDGHQVLLADAGAIEGGIEVPGQEILVQSLDQEVYQDGQLIGNVLQIEDPEGIALVEQPMEYQLISNAKTAATNETNSIMPPIMSALEIPSSKNELVINSKSNETGLIGQTLDDSLAVIGVSAASAVRSSLELPITITNPAIASTTSNSININNLYSAGLASQSQTSPILSSQDAGQLTYELFTSANVITPSHSQHTPNIFSGEFKGRVNRPQESQCLNEIILHPDAVAQNQPGTLIHQANDYIISNDEACDQFVVNSQASSDSNTVYNNPR